MFRALQGSLLSVIYPHDCGVCSGLADDPDDPDSCGRCWSETTFFTGDEMLCGRCGAFLGAKAAPNSVYCRKCDGHEFDSAQALGIYEKALASSIAHLKREPFLSRKLRSRLAPVPPGFHQLRPDILVPVPLSPRRRLERGFNQAEVIANFLSKAWTIPADSGSLCRTVDTPMHRVGMDQKARELTVKAAFEVARPSMIAGKRILLVDDVMTSGATTSACAKSLKAKGAVSVSVFTLARAVMR